MATSPHTLCDPLALRLRVRPDPRQALVAMVAMVAVAVLLALTGSPLGTFAAALERVAAADPLLVGLGVLAEVGSFAGYVALTWLVVGREAPRVTPAVSAHITLAGTAVNRLLPTAGLGGIGLTLWALRRAGLSKARATSTLLTFLVVLYTVFLGALLATGLAALGGSAGDAPAWTGLGLTLLGGGAIAVGFLIGLLGPTRLAAARGGAAPGRVRGAAMTLAESVRGAAAVLRSGDPRLFGALAWWGFDLAVLAAAFAAFGDAPAAGVIALAYFAGIVANTIPVPGAVAGGMTGVLLLCGVPADLALPAVLAYRAISLWVPVPLGAAAMVGLQRTVRTWAAQDALGGHPMAARPATVATRRSTSSVAV